jgi:hypothetical protein
LHGHIIIICERVIVEAVLQFGRKNKHQTKTEEISPNRDWRWFFFAVFFDVYMNNLPSK